MQKILFILFLALFISGNTDAQPEWPENNYRTPQNTFYWKNRPPFPGYWQQDVHYFIQAELSDVTNQVKGKEELTYWNNSPDTLTFVYFHLYQEAFQPGSYSDDLYKVNKVKTYYGPYEKSGFCEKVNSITSNGTTLKTEQDNTILKVWLAKPLFPGASITFNLDFSTWFDAGSVRRRMKIFIHDGVKHFDGVHWYPRIAVYDRRNAWNIDQHLGREFYGDYGSYDVSLTLPANYILEGTGNLLNQDEVLPADLRKKLAISNFAGKPIGEKPSVIIPAGGSKKTWRFHAENVHDFAWTADPTYRITDTVWNGIHCIALAQEENAGKWQTAADFIVKVIQTYSRDFGLYRWPKIVVADARDGMEYPMLTLCGGLEPDFHYVIAHEVGHEWFFGMVGNNETYRAMLDEGFTQFLTVWSENKIDGLYETRSKPRNKYYAAHYRQVPAREESLYLPYLGVATLEDLPPINTHSDQFNSAIGHGGGYGLVYFKTGTMLYNLQYVLGDSLFRAAMSHYFEQWKFCHPYVEDFRNSITQFTHVNLSWFFDEWIETTKYIDYGIKSVKRDSSGAARITFIRRGSMQMPLEFTVKYKDGSAQNYQVPNIDFAKSDGSTVLKPWIGWDMLQPEYNAVIPMKTGIKNIVIDTSMRLADIDLRDNSIGTPKSKYRFDWLISNPVDRRYNEYFWRPDLWYNSIDGIKAGLHIEGSYMNRKDVGSATIWYNTGLLRNSSFAPPRDLLSFTFSFSNPLERLDKNLSWFYHERYNDGLFIAQIGIVKQLRFSNTLTLDYKFMDRPYPSAVDYLLYPKLWQPQKRNATINATFVHAYSRFKSTGSVSLSTRASALFSDYAFSSVSLQEKHTAYIKKFILKGRAIAQFISGNTVPFESQLYLSGANPEEMMENKYVRSRGFIPESWVGYGPGINHFQYGGGLNLRGYAGYSAPYGVDSSQVLTYSGRAGAAVNMELEFGNYFRFKKGWLRNFISFDPYLFTDFGGINTNRSGQPMLFHDFRMDAGLGTGMTIKKWGPFNKVRPLTLRADFPFFVNKSPYIENRNFAFRWVVGVERAF